MDPFVPGRARALEEVEADVKTAGLGKQKPKVRQRA
jgi:hypothetical protein